MPRPTAPTCRHAPGSRQLWPIVAEACGLHGRRNVRHDVLLHELPVDHHGQLRRVTTPRTRRGSAGSDVGDVSGAHCTRHCLRGRLASATACSGRASPTSTATLPAPMPACPCGASTATGGRYDGHIDHRLCRHQLSGRPHKVEAALAVSLPSLQRIGPKVVVAQWWRGNAELGSHGAKDGRGLSGRQLGTTSHGEHVVMQQHQQHSTHTPPLPSH